MNHPTICRGEEIALIFEATEDDRETTRDVSMYDLDLILGTTPLGNKLQASTYDPGKIPIIRPEKWLLAVNLSREMTRSLAPGAIWMEAAMTDKITGTREIFKTNLMEITGSNFGQV